IFRTPKLSLYLTSEPQTGRDENGDGDLLDDVVLLGQASTGGILSRALAVSRVSLPPFRLHPFAISGKIAALIESESSQAAFDENDDGDHEDSILHVLRVGASSASELGPFPFVTASARPVIDGRSLAISKGRVFFRSAEADGAPKLTVKVRLP